MEQTKLLSSSPLWLTRTSNKFIPLMLRISVSIGVIKLLSFMLKRSLGIAHGLDIEM